LAAPGTAPGELAEREERAMATDDIVRLAQAADSTEARIWMQALEAEGIRCRLVGEHLETILGKLPRGQAEIWVYKDDLERGRTILAAHRPER
jgi:hypothetical protein